MNRLAIAILVSAATLVAVSSFAGRILRGYGPHTWTNAYAELNRMQDGMERHQKSYGHLPSVERINEEVAEAWAADTEFYPRAEEREAVHFAFIASFANNDRLRLWDRPPRFTLTDASPVGFGFYLEGEDGDSATKGSDQDDINSWSFDSVGFYHDRVRRNRKIRDFVIGLMGAIPVFLVITRWPARRHETTEAQAE
jgi:hypothetical protein